METKVSFICPVCGNSCEVDQAECDMCGYPYLLRHQSFKTETEKSEWENTVVTACASMWGKLSQDIIATKLNYRNALIKQAELEDQIAEVTQKFYEKAENFESLQRSFKSINASCEKRAAMCEEYASMLESVIRSRDELQIKHKFLKGIIKVCIVVMVTVIVGIILLAIFKK